MYQHLTGISYFQTQKSLDWVLVIMLVVVFGWALLWTISGAPSKEAADPGLSEWAQQNPIDQEDEEDCKEDYILTEVVFLT